MGSHLLLPSILLPTRITTDTKTLIDNIFLTDTRHKSIAGNIICKISDHLPQFILINDANQYSPSDAPVFKRRWSSFNKENFIIDYLDIDWEESLQPVDVNVNESFEIFYSYMSNPLDKHAPYQKLTKKQIKTMAKPWITPGIIKAISERDVLLKLHIKCKSPFQKSLLHSQYKRYRNSLVSLCKLSKSKYYVNYILSNLGNMKKSGKV
jgi:hypothetical protein